MVKEYRCTRNALYQHDCGGRDDITERQGHYIWAQSEEAAWEEMATRILKKPRWGLQLRSG